MSFGSGYVAGASAGNATRRTDLYEENLNANQNKSNVIPMIKDDRGSFGMQDRPQRQIASQRPAATGKQRTDVDPELAKINKEFNQALTGMVAGDYSGLVNYINQRGNPSIGVSRIEKQEDGTVAFYKGKTGGGSITQGDQTLTIPEGEESEAIIFKSDRDLYTRLISQMKPAGARGEIAAAANGKWSVAGSDAGGRKLVNEYDGSTKPFQEGMGYKPATGGGATKTAQQKDQKTSAAQVYQEMIREVAQKKGMNQTEAEIWADSVMTVDADGAKKVDKDRLAMGLDDEQNKRLNLQLGIAEKNVGIGMLPQASANNAVQTNARIMPFGQQERDKTAADKARYGEIVSQLPKTPEGAAKWQEMTQAAIGDQATTEEGIKLFGQEVKRLRRFNPDLAAIVIRNRMR